MSKRPSMTTKEYLINAPLPEATDTYTVVPHKDVIERTEQTLEKMGFEIEREFYKCNLDAKIAQGIYHLKYGDDPDIGMLFTWSNSYDKSMRFKCCVGGYVHESLASIISGNMGTYARKHTGDADSDVLSTIDSQLINAEEYFKDLLIQKDKMLNLILTSKIRAELTGRMYFEHELFTSEQLSIIGTQYKKSSYAINGESNTVWYMYHAILIALQRAHPRTWMEQQIISHNFIEKEFMLVNTKQDDVLNESEPEVISNQITILDVIAEVEAEQVVEEEVVEDVVETAPWDEEPVTLEEEVVPEKSVELFSALVGEDESEDDGWPCVSCNEMQGAEAVWNDGQLCSRCADASMITNINLEL